MNIKEKTSVPISLLKTIRLSRLNRLMKENVGLVYTTLGGLGATVLGAFFWLILAAILNVDNYGLANYYIALANIGAGVGTIGLNITLMKYLSKEEKNLVSEANSITLISGLSLALILSLFHWAAGIVAATTIFFNMTLSELLGTKKYRKYAVISIGQSITQIILSLLLYYFFGIIGILLGYFLGSLAFSYKYFYSIRRNFTLTFNTIKEKRTFIFHSYGFNLIGKRLANYLDKVIIGALFGYYALGLYQLGFQFFLFLSIIPTSLYQYLLPEESSGNNKKEIKIIGLILSIAVAIIAYILAPFLIQNMFPAFIESIQLVQVMSLAVVPSTVVAILTAEHLSKEKSRLVLISALVYLVSLIIGLIILEKIMGVLGFALAVIIAQSIQALYLIVTRN